MNIDRKKLIEFACEQYGKVKGHRSYALTPETKAALGALVGAVIERRKAEGRHYSDDHPYCAEEITALIQRLDDAGINILQKRPGEAPKLPELWEHPLTAEPLPPPKTPDERAILAKHDPELLALLDEFEMRPYATTQKLRAAEAHRQALAAIPYGPSEHKTNKFVSGTATEQAALMKSDPVLAEFLRRESQPVSIPIFGKNKNMTIEGKLIRDPAIAATVRVAQRIYEDCREQDRLAAREQHAAADAALKKLDAEAA
jgi:hypothetical protein